ncbi:2568_t:CDS:1 [Dentiscutata erythropus]|uniref:2568_t:CDS:1 n=1 Tax=Dentiscutata erythropus TaxID=1348616 RepID=A0A9N9GWZ6_9GLOM|nr:2568_t:CDS:1 [Dentiscutata erythropus]
MCKIENIVELLAELNVIHELESKTFLSLKELITPKKKKTKSNLPRVQNSFMIFRKDFAAYWFSLTKKNDLKEVSQFASDLWNGNLYNFKLWNNINIVERKNIYYKISSIAEMVYKKLYPDYKYCPKRKKISHNEYIHYGHVPQQLEINGANSYYKPYNFIQQLNINLKNIMN